MKSTSAAQQNKICMETSGHCEHVARINLISYYK